MFKKNCINLIIIIIALSLSNINYAAELDPNIAEFTRSPDKRNVKISPDGKYLSVIYRQNATDVLVILDAKTKKVKSGVKVEGQGKGVGKVFWVSDSRLVYGITKYDVWDKQRYDTGQLAAVNIDGSQHELIFGHGIFEENVGTNIKRKSASYGSQTIIDFLDDDDDNILIAFYPWKETSHYWKYDPEAIPIIYKLNVYNGKKRKVERLPLARADAITDNNGIVRFSSGIDNNGAVALYYKAKPDSDWEEFLAKKFEGENVYPLSFTEDNQSVYLTANVGKGTEALYLFNLADHSFEKLYHNPKVDIDEYIKDFQYRRVIAVGIDYDKPEYFYLDEKNHKAKLHKALVNSFKDYNIIITSVTKDAKQIVVYVYSDKNPGDYYLFNTEDLKADFLLTKRSWVNLAELQPMKPMEFTMRDGTLINGYLTLPKTSEKSLPLIVLPHGGPHGVRDYWGFDSEAQLFAKHGYAVLQVNYRGSSGFGTEYEEKGYGQWGGLMQTDISDAILSLTKSGQVDSDRICIYGASYGGYAALMGAVQEPDLYQCVIGYVGVYNLPMMFTEGDIPKSKYGLAYLKKVLGTDVNKQKKMSPVYNVDKIKAEVLLIHGGRDQRVPLEQAESLQAAFDEIGKSYEWLVLDDEGHGASDDNNRYQIYKKMISFLDKSIGKSSKKNTNE